ncbi:MAG: response regulator transcription factor [Bacteroidetes bacterium]|nr:MAG: response regulator transcription factor [Bacteroidota bacterium]
MIKVALADDHEMFTEGLASVFKNSDSIKVIHRSNSGEQLLERIKEETPDVVLLDITMPGAKGDSVAAEILRRYPDVKIIMLTMHQSADYVLPLVDLGVHGFMLKNATNIELQSAIQLVNSGKKYFTEEAVKVISRRNIQEEKEDIQLTRREHQILQLLYEGLSAADMAERMFISQYTVFKHRQNLLNKCGCKSATQLVNFAISKGWISLPSED